MRLTGWGIYWLVWLVGGFGIAETIGILTNVKDTLSWQVWGLEAINFTHPLDFADWTPAHYVLGILLLIFTVWLTGHLIFGIWR